MHVFHGTDGLRFHDTRTPREVSPMEYKPLKSGSVPLRYMLRINTVEL